MKKDEIVKEIILQAAARVFRKWGLNKTTMEDIAREAGKGKSTLYYYYKSKEEIFETVVIKEFEGLLLRAKTSTLGIHSAKGKIRTYIISSLTEMKKTTNVYSIVRAEMSDNSAFIQKLIAYIELREVAFMRELLLLGAEDKDFTFADEAELDNAAHVIIGVVRAMNIYLFIENDNPSRIDMAAKLIANGI